MDHVFQRIKAGQNILRDGDDKLYRFGITHFTQGEIATGQTLTHQAAIAIERLRLFTEIQKSARQLEALYQTSRALSSSLEEEPVVHAVLDAVYRTLGCEHVILSTVDEETGNPIVWYDQTVFSEAGDPTRRVTKMEVDLVVLCQALVPHGVDRETEHKLGLELDESGFIIVQDRLVSPVDTSVPGIFACGFCQQPQDIPDSVVQASAAAARVVETLSQELEHA